MKVEQILDELVVKSDNSMGGNGAVNKSLHKFTVLKDKNNKCSEPSCSSFSPKTSTSTPVYQRNGFQGHLSREQSLIEKAVHDQVHSPFSDSQWSDYGDETYIEATQTSKTCNEVNQNTFDLMDSLEMTENSEHNGYLTAACDILEASMAQNNEQKSQQSQDRDVNIQHRYSFLNYQTKGNKETKGSNSSGDTLFIDEFDSFSSPNTSSDRNGNESYCTTPKKQKLSAPDVVKVSPARNMLRQLTFE